MALPLRRLNNVRFSLNKLNLIANSTSDDIALLACLQQELSRVLSLLINENCGLGFYLLFHVVVGSGIFISPRSVAMGSGSVGMTLLSWVLCGVISILGKYQYKLTVDNYFDTILNCREMQWA